MLDSIKEADSHAKGFFKEKTFSKRFSTPYQSSFFPSVLLQDVAAE